MNETEDTGAISPKLRAAMDRFDAAYAEWLVARADLAAQHQDGDSEAAEQRRADRESAAELALATTPAPHASAVWQKWAFVEHYVASDLDAGESIYPLVVVALASLRADIMVLGLKPWPHA
jgi:hypothetical protein